MTIYPKSQHHYNRYIKFIETRRNRTVRGAFDKHHIIPKSMGGSDEISNIIKLTYREHFLAHWMLWKAFDNAQMTHAFWFMTQKKMSNLSSRTYQVLKESRLNLLKGNTNASGKRSIESRTKMSNAQLNSLNHPTRGKKRPNHSKKMSGKNNPMFGIPAPNLGKKLNVVICPNCGKQGAGGAMRQWHFANCRHPAACPS
jgi:hypothetical protein